MASKKGGATYQYLYKLIIQNIWHVGVLQNAQELHDPKFDETFKKAI